MDPIANPRTMSVTDERWVWVKRFFIKAAGDSPTALIAEPPGCLVLPRPSLQRRSGCALIHVSFGARLRFTADRKEVSAPHRANPPHSAALRQAFQVRR